MPTLIRPAQPADYHKRKPRQRTHRQARSISYRIGEGKFPVLKDLDKFVFADTLVDEGLVRDLATV